ncbi:MAG: 2-amino-4-hydroxy-6-hydroxymethyldihydropteridine diphosphokinase [Turicibacter sp.]|nr:2-amino-4-hydroxy-6-hydroxymethyldihydropteridine diphosphokinase [Turicibacter sp.]
MVKAYLGLGSNLGDRRAYLTEALSLLGSNMEITNQSPLYETKPWGVTDQEPYLNLAVEVQTDLEPEELLQLCQQIEHALDRVRDQKWGPRTMDIDILLYGSESIDAPDLKVPHPYLTQRDFVVIPLADIAPKVKVQGKILADWAHEFDVSLLRKISK